MSLTDLALLVVAGFGAGLIGYITGLASIVSYPALLAVGLTPIAANVTNTVALVAVGVGSTAQSGRALLDGDRRRLVIGLIAALIGGTIGAVLLLLTPAEAFEALVPFLVAVAATALLVQPVLRRWATSHAERPWIFVVGLMLICIYGGYFGAGAGIMILALMLLVSSEPLWRAALSKSVFLGVANAVAAVGFMIFGPVDWWAALAMAIGCLLGGWCGPPVVKRLPAGPLRIVVGLCGLGLAVWLAVG
ncbi:sulfite exporter TauE/SafE family protein [Gordonia rubripertincta]|uniref:sulfite exporter TauE/SafE family protein n=1 Tax=Gordonia rubripertincta TaxID=36822 RepID=UPI001180D7A3|nr:sulfite exporter TauE/SafE family protein [Gordonia rubripertincta]TSD97164.1 sulfite exporter TauE/SafE family protein [Gordonia rubripertincta]